MLDRTNARERPRIEASVAGADEGTMNATDSLGLHWPEYLMEAGESSLLAPGVTKSG